MIASYGEGALITCVILSFLHGSYFKKLGNLRIYRLESIFIFSLLAIAMGTLAWSFVADDFSLRAVVMGSHSQQPLIYKLSALWGSHGGSMLLWVFMLSLMHCVYTIWGLGREKVTAFEHWTSQINLITIGLFAFYVLAFANPFEPMDAFVHEGLGLNPLLQDPSMLFHPPSLYMGLVGFMIPFSMACAAWILKGVKGWQAKAEPWVLFAWGTLTLGITLGSYWAYYELGWGGWWFWDPVENLSVLPWLMGIAAIHGLQKKDESDMVHYILLKIFPIFLLGTFLVRSGLLASVHSFAAGANQLTYLLGVACLYFLPVLGLYIQNFHGFWKGLLGRTATFRDLSMLLNMTGFAVMTLIVALATFVPAWLNYQQSGAISVGPEFFQATFVPVAAVILSAMVLSHFLGKLITQKVQGNWLSTYTRFQWPLFLIVFTLALGAYFVPHKSPFAILGILLFVLNAIALYRTRDFKRLWFKLYHTCVLISMLGMSIDHLGRIEQEVPLKPEASTKLGCSTITFKGQKLEKGNPFDLEEAFLEIKSSTGNPWGLLHPQKRLYHQQNALTAEVDILTRGLSQYYVALGGLLPTGERLIFMAYHPGVVLIWLGGVLIFLLTLGQLILRRLGRR